MLKPKEITAKDYDGDEKTFIISKFPATIGREILAKYPVSNIPKLGEYQASDETMLKLMSHVAVPIEGRDEPLRLTTRTLVENHVNDAEQLLRIEMAMMEYNFSFFGKGGSSTFFAGLIKKYLPLIMSTLTDSLPPSLARDLQASLNSKKS